MFDIDLQINNSEKNRVTKNIDNVLTVSGELKNLTSIIDPTILIEADLSDIVDANYMTISEFNRSYFITDIKSIRTGLVEISGHVDVLSSFADSILSNRAIIHRQENLWNLYLNDGSFRVYQNPNVVTHPFPQGFGSLHYVMAIAGV